MKINKNVPSPINQKGHGLSKKDETFKEPKDTVILGNKEKDSSPDLKGPGEIKKFFQKNGKVLSNSHTQERARELLERKKEGIKEEVIVNTDKHMHSIFHGVPDFVNSYDHKGVAFRHYFKTEDQKESALNDNSLIAGPVPYVQKGGMRYDYVDLVGVFLTKPEVEPDAVGVPGHNLYIDLTLPPDTAVLEIEPGRIYMIGGDPKRPDWIVESYKKYKSGEEIPAYMKSTMERIDGEGGIKEPTKVYFHNAEKE